MNKRIQNLVLAAVVVSISACGKSDPLGAQGKGLLSGPITAAIGPSLQSRMASLADGETLEVIVAFRQKQGIAKSTATSLQGMGLKGGYFKYLPIAGVVATRAQIEQLARRPDVRSLWHNDELQYDNEEARYLSSVDQAQAAPELKNASGEPFTGKGVGILVNDSGIDGLHPDLMNRVVANAIGHTNLRGLAENEMLPFTPTECAGPCNSDFGGSHGSHVAGIAAGDGSASAGRYAGAAKGASLIGYGSGATLLVLDTLGGFDYALQILDEHPEYNLRIVTNSFGSTGDQGSPFNPEDPTNIVTKVLADRGLLVVFSAGNSGSGPDSITGNFKKAPWIMIAANGEKSGLLAPSSSRGTLVDPVYEVEVDGEKFTVEDRPTVVTAGTNIISARAVAADPFLPLDLIDDVQNPAFTPQQVPFYTLKTGTSMSAPHLAGLTALLLEANPALSWREAKTIFKATATNMPGYDPWEAGAGFANVEAALAMALNLRSDYGKVNHAARSFNASIPVGERVVSENHSISFVTAGPTESVQFEVGPDIALVIAIMEFQAPCSCSVVLIDPDGKERRSSGALAVLAPRVTATATGKSGTWTLTVRGLRTLSGVVLDPTGLTNGASAPATVDVTLDQYAFQQSTGLGDITGHPLRGFIEGAIRERLMDGMSGGFKPNADLLRADFAEYLMAWGVRQTRSHAGGNRFSDIPPANGVAHAAAEAVTRTGALILSKSPQSLPLLRVTDSKFLPGARVTREEIAYALVQAIGRQAQAEAHNPATMTATDDAGNSAEVVDADMIDPALRGHVQEALNLKIMDAEFTGGKARVNPKSVVKRADYAAAAFKTFVAVPFP